MLWVHEGSNLPAELRRACKEDQMGSARADRGQEGDRWMEKRFAPGDSATPALPAQPCHSPQSCGDSTWLALISPFVLRTPHGQVATFRLVAEVGRWWWWQGSYLQLLKLSTTLDMDRGSDEEERCAC